MLEQNIWTGTVDGIEIKWQQGGINRPDEQSKEVSTDTLTFKATTERMAYASTVRLGRTRVVIRSSFHRFTVDTTTGQQRPDAYHATIQILPHSSRLNVHIYADLFQGVDYQTLQPLAETVIPTGQRAPDPHLSFDNRPRYIGQVEEDSGINKSEPAEASPALATEQSELQQPEVGTEHGVLPPKLVDPEETPLRTYAYSPYSTTSLPNEKQTNTFKMADKLRTIQNLEAMQARYVGTGHADTTKYDWVSNIVRDSYASYVGHPPLLSYMAVGMGEPKEKVRAAMIEKMVRGAGNPPETQE